MSFFNGHNHTDYSNIRGLDCICKVNKLIDYAIDLGLSGIAITDHETVSGHIKAMKYLEEKKAKARKDKEKLDDSADTSYYDRVESFKLGLGNEIYLCRDGLTKKNYIKGEDSFWHFILIAKDKIGHKQIRELSSRAWSRSFWQFVERVPTYYSDIEEIIGKDKGHIIASTACLGSQFDKFILNKQYDKALNFVNWCRSIFGEDFYIELQPGSSSEQTAFNSLCYNFVKENNLKAIITTDTHYLKKEDRIVHKAYLNSNDSEREVDAFYSDTYLMSEEEICEKMSYLDKDFLQNCFSNSMLIYDSIEEYSLAHKQIVPRIPMLAERIYPNTGYKAIDEFLNSKYVEDRFFIGECLYKLKKLGIEDKSHMDRLEAECNEMWIVSEKIEERLSAYFITVRKVIDIAWTEGDSIVGPWRGSVGAMLTAYLMDIIQRDPLLSPSELPYWRFCSRGRAELADVDIDTQASKRQKFIGAVEEYFESIGGELTVVATFGTETSKAALQTACRGLEYEPELGSYLSSLIPVDRGFVRSLSQCYFGDEEKGFTPIAQFVNEMKKHEDIWEIASKIEGLISRRGTHASGVILTNDKFTEFGATMKSPSGVKCSQWELHDEEFAGHIKYDFLTVDALDRIRVTLDLLIERGYIEKQNSLKETYCKYIDPNILDYDNKEMWSLVGENKIISLFQFDTPVGLQAARQIKPESLLELAQANSLMRLMPEAGERTPVEEFVRYKENPDILLREISVLKATDFEKKVLYDFMKGFGGVLDSQESLMLAVMLPFTNYSVDEANKVRKVVAKKKMAEIEQTRKDYFKRGESLGTSHDILHYIWDVQASRQMGYSFSIVHTIAYSTVAIQELNLAYKFPPIFWNTACLIVDSDGIEEEEEEIEEEVEDEDVEIDEDGEEEEIKQKTKKKTKVVKYGKISTAIGKMKHFGIDVRPPDINRSSFTFSPDLTTGQIVYGIKGILKVNSNLAHDIIANRPYTSFDDFISKVKCTKLQIINLIKSGAFDEIEKRDRITLMNDYVMSISDCKKKLTLQNMPTLINRNIIPEEYSHVVKVFNFNKFLKKNKCGDFYILDDYSQEFYSNHWSVDNLSFNDSNTCFINQKVWDKIYKKEMDTIRPFLALPSTLESLNNKLIEEVVGKYSQGNISKWEMDSIGFYYGPHELEGIDLEQYNIDDYFSLPDDPVVKNVINMNGKEIPLFYLNRIAGTVIEKDKLKNTVTLLTKEGVVKVKIYKSQFVKYDKQIFMKDPETGKKKIIEKSWFTRGNKLVITGIKRSDNFIPKKYKNTPYPVIELVTEIDYENSRLKTTSERAAEV